MQAGRWLSLILKMYAGKPSDNVQECTVDSVDAALAFPLPEQGERAALGLHKYTVQAAQQYERHTGGFQACDDRYLNLQASGNERLEG